MPTYKAPQRDMQFLHRELLQSDEHYKKLAGCEEMTPDLLDAFIDSSAKFSENVLAPLNRVGDEQGCVFDNGEVKTPDGFKEAFEQYAEAGYQSMRVPVADGGQGLPPSPSVFISEIVGSANWAWSMYGGLANAPITLLVNGGTAEQKQTYLPNLINGRWAGTMCLTESHCGSDVGLLRTKAAKNSDGSYQITGTKIFISGGEQDMTENIIHTVLARVEGAPEGNKGITLFVVPKVHVNADGSLGERNGVHCGSIEKKMGIKGSATCVMNFDAATGYILGEENKGLEQMFSMMNPARLGTALQGVSMGEASFQGALAYARERLQMRSLTGPKNPDGKADPIIVHPDVRRMLMTQKVLTEGSRAFICWLSFLSDEVLYADEETSQSADDLLSLLTPIAKAFCTETAFETANLGLQVFGGHGYISEHGMEQIVRDARIAMVYEGTTGIQSLDLLGRKVMGSGGKLLSNFTKLIHKFCEAHKDNAAMLEFVTPLVDLNKELGDITVKIGEKAMENADEVGAASVDYTMYCGYIAIAFMWARMAQLAQTKLAAGSSEDTAFYEAKVVSAQFYFQRILPRSKSHCAAALAGGESMMALPEQDFAF